MVLAYDSYIYSSTGVWFGLIPGSPPESLPDFSPHKSQRDEDHVPAVHKIWCVLVRPRPSRSVQTRPSFACLSWTFVKIWNASISQREFAKCMLTTSPTKSLMSTSKFLSTLPARLHHITGCNNHPREALTKDMSESETGLHRQPHLSYPSILGALFNWNKVFHSKQLANMPDVSLYLSRAHKMVWDVTKNVNLVMGKNVVL